MTSSKIKLSGQNNPVCYKVEKLKCHVRFEKALALTLFCLIVIMIVFRRVSINDQVKWRKNRYEIFQVEYIPNTHRVRKSFVPSAPIVPLVNETEIFPDIEELDLTDLKPDNTFLFRNDLDELPDEDTGLVRNKPDDSQNAKNGEVVLDLLVNQYGRVDSVRVVKNTTQSKSFEVEAINRAFRGRYLFEDGRMQESRWIERSFSFKKKE